MRKLDITGLVNQSAAKRNNVTHISIEHPKKDLPAITIVYHVDFVARKLVKKEIIDNKINCNPKK